MIKGGSVAVCSVTLGIFSFRILQSQVYQRSSKKSQLLKQNSVKGLLIIVVLIAHQSALLNVYFTLSSLLVSISLWFRLISVLKSL